MTDHNQRNIVSKLKHLTSDEVKQYCIDSSYNYDIMALNIHSDLNIGNMMKEI